MILKDLKTLFHRDLDGLYQEIESYEDDSFLWKTTGEIKNSAGNLALHLIGNLNHFIGATLGQSGYIRNREAEFGDKNVPVTDLLKAIKATHATINTVLDNLPKEKIDETYPIEVFGAPMKTSFS